MPDKYRGCLLLMMIGTGAFAQQIALRLEPHLRYSEPGLECTNEEAPATLLFSARLNGEKVWHATIQMVSPDFIPARLDLLPEESAWIRVRKQATGAYWFRDLPLSARVIEWVLYNASLPGTCRPSITLHSLAPKDYPFAFDWPDRPTAWAHFEGSLHDGRPYRAELRFAQKGSEVIRARRGRARGPDAD